MNPPPPPPPRGGLDPTFDVDAAPRVGQPSSLWPIVFGIVGALGLGTVVFLQLNANRQTQEQKRLTDAAPAAAPISTQGVPPAPDMSQFAQAQPEPVLIPDPPEEPEPQLVQGPPVAPGPTQAELDRLRAPALVVDLGEYKAPAAGVATVGPDGKPLDPAALAAAATAASNQGAALTKNADESFAQRLGTGLGGSTGKTAKAEHLRNLSTTIIQGEIVPAVLETALNSDLPGMARAVVTRDIRGFDGTKVLIPRGARLIGEYKAGVEQGQSRAFLIWTRLIRSDGVSIDLGSPATDSLGRTGLTGNVDRHFLQRFGGAILLSLLSIGGNAIADSTDTTVVIAGAQAGTSAAASALSGGDTQIKPTVTVPQGTPVRVFVNQDLDFTSVGPAKTMDAPN
jgi:type IV secretion system protein VirB10